MNHLPFNPTDTQRANLMRLAAHLDLGVTNLRFNMSDFDGPEDSGDEAHNCGTVGCAVGHGPSLGIAPINNESWCGYARRCFGVAFGTEYNGNSPYFMWMFGGMWSGTDNTPRGAAARINYALKHGIPHNYERQMSGDVPLSYTVPDRIEAPMVKVAAEETL